MTSTIQILSCILYTTVLVHNVVEQSIGLTIDIVHRYAPQSPFYNASLTHQEIVRRQNLHTFKSHKQQTTSINSTTISKDSSIDLTYIRPAVDVDPYFLPFLVKVNLGTFPDSSHPHKSYFLDLDTGSSLTWLQCEDCKKRGNRCFRQIDPPYPNSKSTSYKPGCCDDQCPNCNPQQCATESCPFELTYYDNSFVKGVLAYENFAFPSNNGQEEIVSLLFGCGIKNRKAYHEHRNLKSAGMFGMGWDDVSFVNQIHSISQGRFSYCLPLAHRIVQGSPAFLRFGSDIPTYSNLPSTRMLLYQNDQSYYANLVDISINGVKLNIPYAYFRKGGDNIGGCNFDTGSLVTRISPPAYQMVRQALLTVIARSDTGLEFIGKMDGFDICYRRPKPSRGYINLPTITFHFVGNVVLVVKPEAAFYRDVTTIRYEYLCSEMVPSDASRMTVIGSHAQANHFIVYDVPRRRLHFGPRDCYRNP